MAISIERALGGLLLSAAMAWGADVTGKWKASVHGRDGAAIDVEFNFKQDGDKLTGTVVGPQGERPISDGKMDGDKVSFGVEGPDGGTFKLAGTTAGDEMKLAIELGDRKIDINAKRAAK